MSGQPMPIPCPYCQRLVNTPWPWTPRKCHECERDALSTSSRPARSQRGGWKPSGAMKNKPKYRRGR